MVTKRRLQVMFLSLHTAYCTCVRNQFVYAKFRLPLGAVLAAGSRSQTSRVDKCRPSGGRNNTFPRFIPPSSLDLLHVPVGFLTTPLRLHLFLLRVPPNRPACSEFCFLLMVCDKYVRPWQFQPAVIPACVLHVEKRPLYQLFS